MWVDTRVLSHHSLLRQHGGDYHQHLILCRCPPGMAAIRVLRSHHEEQQPWTQWPGLESMLCCSLGDLVT